MAVAPEGVMWLNVTEVNRPERNVSVLLSCNPDVGTHPNLKLACDALRFVDGDISALPVQDEPCLLIARPVKATAVGTWGGTTVNYERTFGNPCEMYQATGAVFEFVLP